MTARRLSKVAHFEPAVATATSRKLYWAMNARYFTTDQYSSVHGVMSLRERTRPGLGIIEPCLPSPAKVPPSGPGWLHEIKHDGFRASPLILGSRRRFTVALKTVRLARIRGWTTGAIRSAVSSEGAALL